MIIKVFNQGSCDGSRHISYLLSEESHEGYRPEVIFGDAAITKAAVKATKTKHRYTAGVISFKQGEDLTELQQQQLIADFKKAFAPFDDLKPPRKPEPTGSREFQPMESLHEENQIQ